MPVQIRRGDMQDFVPDNLLQGEPAFADDNGTHRFFIGTGNDAKAIELARQDEIQRATQAQAHQGTDNNMIMTPLRTKEHVDYRIASQGQALNGTDNSTLITPLRANDLYNDRTQKCYSVTASDSSYITIYVTDSYVSDVDGAEIIIKPSRTITATSYIYLNLNGNSLIITKPTGMPSDYVTTLTKDVPYRLKRTIVGSSSRWVAMDYKDDTVKEVVSNSGYRSGIFEMSNGLLMQWGDSYFTVDATNTTYVNLINFTRNFSNVPVVSLTIFTASPLGAGASISSLTGEKLEIAFRRSDGKYNATVGWLAIGEA